MASPILYGGNGVLGITQSAATLIQFLIPPAPDRLGYTHITDFQYTDGATSHTLTFVRPLGRTTTVGVAAAGQAVIVIQNDPGSLLPTPDHMVSNDYIAIRESDGITRLYQFSSAVSLTTVTLTGNLLVGTLNGASFWFLGTTADTDQRTGQVQPNYATAGGSSLLNLSGTSGAGGVATVGKDEPILFNSNNITNAGKLNLLYFAYSLS